MHGREWIVEAHGCVPPRLADPAVVAALLDQVIGDLSLSPVAPPQWHKFPAPGGVTGVAMLAESHLTVHTFPEHGSLCMNLFCCGPRPEWDFAAALRARFDAQVVQVRCFERAYGPMQDGKVARTTPVSVRIVRAG
ncbi:MAG: S-adenosylmethionine decarboxylase [Gemmatimonadetes bacterium]|nr:S-adenosylmethionine decarboxylase [Gemmatimonadota bacterium]